MQTIEILSPPEQVLRLRWPPAAQDEAVFQDLCRANPDYRIELNAQGEIEIMPPTGMRTGRRNARLIRLLEDWSERDGTGAVFDSSTGFRLPDGATRSPDVSWVRRERLMQLSPQQRDGFAPLAPDFVIELLSGSDSLGVAQTKMEEYRRNGVRLGWLIDPEARRVHVYRPSRPVEVLDGPDQVRGDPELAGLVLDLRAIWEPGV